MTTNTFVKRPRRLPLPLLDLGPWAGGLLLLSFVFMSASKFTTDPSVQLPAISTSQCMMGSPDLIISVDAQNRFYLSIYDGYNKFSQTEVVQQIAKQHGVEFTDSQLAALCKVSFIGQDVRQLPAWLSTSPFKRQQFSIGIPVEPGNNQLSEYIAAVNKLSLAERGRPIYYCLIRADERLSAAQVQCVFHLLQEQGINQFGLSAELK